MDNIYIEKMDAINEMLDYCNELDKKIKEDIFICEDEIDSQNMKLRRLYNVLEMNSIMLKLYNAKKDNIAQK